MVDETNSLEEIRAYFAQDKFAAQAQCSIIEAAPNHAICEMPITENHLNANGTVMGGAMFTLADFTMAIISNMDNKPTVAIDCTIRFFSPAKGEKAHRYGQREQGRSNRRFLHCRYHRRPGNQRCAVRLHRAS